MASLRRPAIFLRRCILGLHTQVESDNATTELVNAICDSMRRGHHWNALTQFGSMDMADSLVEKVLLRLKRPEDAKRALGFFHWSAKTRNRRHTVYSYAIAIHVLVRAGLLKDARALIESLLTNGEGDCTKFEVVDSLLETYEAASSSPRVFDLLVEGYAKLRIFNFGFDISRRLSDSGFSLSVTTFNTLLRVVQKSCEKELVWQIYEHMINNRTMPNENTTKIMVSALCKEGKLKFFLDVLDRVHGKRCSPFVLVNAGLVFKVLEEGRIDEGLSLLKRFLQKNMILDTIGYSLVVYAKVKLGDFASAWCTYEEMLKRGFSPNSFVHTAFIGLLCKNGRIEEAKYLMCEMEELGLDTTSESFEYLLEGCSMHGKAEESLNFCKKMIEKGILPSCLAFNRMVGNLGGIQSVRHSNTILTTLIDKGFMPDESTYSLLICGYTDGDEIQEALKLYHEMQFRAFCPGLQVYKSLIDCLCRCGKIEEAEKYLRNMKTRVIQPTAEIYERLIVGYCEVGEKNKAYNLYDEMVSEGFQCPKVEACIREA